MRAEDFLEDLEAAAAAQARAEQWHELADTVRVENARVELRDRARGSLGAVVTAYVGGVPFRGTCVDVSPFWLAIDTETSRAVETTSDVIRRGIRVIAWPALEAISVSPRHRHDEESTLGRTWQALFRQCAIARTCVVWHTRAGQSFTGMVGAVGNDHVVLTDRGTHMALATAHLAVLEPFAAHPDRRDAQKSSRMRPA